MLHTALCCIQHKEARLIDDGFTLWDTDTGNVVGYYATEAEAKAVRNQIGDEALVIVSDAEVREAEAEAKFLRPIKEKL